MSDDAGGAGGVAFGGDRHQLVVQTAYQEAPCVERESPSSGNCLREIAPMASLLDPRTNPQAAERRGQGF